MKHSVVLFALVLANIFLPISNSSRNLLAFDSVLYAVPPCPSSSTVSWQEHPPIIICAFEYDNLTCDDSCCFSIYFSEKWDVVNGFNVYDINIVKIVSNIEGCETCNLDSIMDDFYRFWMGIKSMEPGFMDKYKNNGKMPDTVTQYLYTGDTCRTIGDSICLEILCCFQIYKVVIDTASSLIDTIFAEPDDYMIKGDSCMPPCQSRCKKYPFPPDTVPPLPPIFVKCGLNCTGPMEKDSVVVTDYGGCAGCTIKFNYHKGQTTNCDPNYFDIFLDSVITVGCTDTSCHLEAEDLFMYMIDTVLKKEGMENLTVGQCDTNWRVAHASCWGFFWDYIWQDWDSSWSDSLYYIYRPCDLTDCCAARYIVCKFSQDSVNYEYYQDVGDTIYNEFCLFAVTPCIFVCDLTKPPVPISPNNFKDTHTKNKIQFNVLTIPNPTTGLTDIYIESEFQGTLKLIVYNINGSEVMSSNIDKKAYKIIAPVNLKSQPSGVYQYRLLDGTEVMHSGKITLQK